MTFNQVVEYDTVQGHPPIMERYLTVEQAAEVLQVHPDTVRQWLRGSQLAGRKIGRIWRIPESEIRKLLQPNDGNAQEASQTVGEDA